MMHRMYSARRYLSLRRWLDKTQLFLHRWLRAGRALAGRETLRRLAQRRSFVPALEGLEDRVMPASAPDALTLPALVPSALAQTPLAQAFEQRLDTVMATARETYAKLQADAQQIRNQAGTVLSGLAAIEWAALTQPLLGQTTGNGLAPLMQATHEAFAALLTDTAKFWSDLRSPLLPPTNSPQASTAG